MSRLEASVRRRQNVSATPYAISGARVFVARRGSMGDRTMRGFLNTLNAMKTDTRGVTALEYGLIAGLVAVVIVTSVTSLGTKLTSTFTTIAAALP